MPPGCIFLQTDQYLAELSTQLDPGSEADAGSGRSGGLANMFASWPTPDDLRNPNTFPFLPPSAILTGVARNYFVNRVICLALDSLLADL